MIVKLYVMYMDGFLGTETKSLKSRYSGYYEFNAEERWEMGTVVTVIL